MSHLLACSILLVSGSSIPASYANHPECWSESEPCSLKGALEVHTYPGGRTSKNGEDILETNLYLKIEPPIRVHFKDWDNHESPTTELVTLMQIAGEFDHRLFKVAKKGIGNRVIVKAKIFGRETGHHHTKFLIDANNNIVVDKE